ncbi:MAG: Gfo/Idh/MocA family oxidoreductase [Clostridia bacterium]
MNDMKLGVIGLGSIAESMMILFRLTRGVRVTALCDIDSSKLDRHSRRFKKAKAYIDYNELLADDGVDCVYIALPHWLHDPVMEAAILHGKHIFCEKPLTTDAGNGKRIMELAGEAGIKVAVNYQYRYDRNCYSAVQAIRQGLLGDIRYVRCYVPWSRDITYFTKAPWHGSLAKSGGGSLITQGSHFLDIILWALDCRLKDVNAILGKFRFPESETEDFSCFQAVMENGTILQFACTMAEQKERPAVMEFIGDKGTISYRKVHGSSMSFHGIKKMKAKPGGLVIHPAQGSLIGFRDWVNKEIPHLCTGDDSLAVLEEIAKIYEDGDRRE